MGNCGLQSYSHKQHLTHKFNHMKKNETLEKIKAGTIRIENCQLVGLGNDATNPIDIRVLDEFMSETEKEGAIEALVNTTSGICQVLAYFATNSAKYPDVLEEISPMLPTSGDIYRLNNILKLFTR